MINPLDVLAEAARVAPAEACGITLNGIAVPLTNISLRPATTFKVSPDELANAIAGGGGALWDGVWHSHPDGAIEPSADDLAWHPPRKRLYIVADGVVYEYDSTGHLIRALRG